MPPGIMAVPPLIARPNDDDQPNFSTLAMLLSGMNRRDNSGDATGSGTVAGTGNAPVAAAPAPAPAPAASVPAAPAMPNVPKYTPPDMARRQELERMATAAPPNPNDYRPSIWDRIFGGMVTAGAAYQHNPNAMDLGRSIVTQKYNRAMDTYGLQKQSNRQSLDEFDKDADLNQRDFSDQMSVFHGEMERAREEREGRGTDARNKKLEAEAGYKDYKSMGPTDRAKELPDIEQALGHGLTSDQRDYFVINGELPKAQKEEKDDLNPEHVILESIPKGPGRTKKAQELFDKSHREKKETDPNAEKPMTQQTIRAINDKKSKGLKSTEDWYQGEYADKVAPRYQDLKSSKPLPGMTIEQSRAARQKTADDADAQLKQELQKRKQQSQDDYENDISAQGKGVQHVEYGGEPQKQTTSKEQPSAQPAPAAQKPGPPASLFTKGDGHTLQLKNKATGAIETWKMVGGTPQLISSEKPKK
jgi:hypothetical protein